MIDQDIIVKRLEKLNQYLQLLEQLGKKTEQQFVNDPFVHGNAERYLQLAIQTCLDIGNHILANRATKTPDEYRDIFILLGEHDLLPKTLAEKMAPMAGLRNILVHDYLDIDLKKLYLLLKNNLDDFRAFAKAISKKVL